MTKHEKRRPHRLMISKAVLIALGLIVGVLTILILRGLRPASSSEVRGAGDRPRGLAAAPAGAALPSSDPAGGDTASRAGEATRGDSPDLRVPTPTPPEPQPWESSPATAPKLAPGFEPAWAVNPTRDQPVVPPEPQAPPNPIANRPQGLNPGGVEGKRGPIPDAVSRRRANDRSAQAGRTGTGETRVRLKPDN